MPPKEGFRSTIRRLEAELAEVRDTSAYLSHTLAAAEEYALANTVRREALEKENAHLIRQIIRPLEQEVLKSRKEKKELNNAVVLANMRLCQCGHENNALKARVKKLEEEKAKWMKLLRSPAALAKLIEQYQKRADAL